MRSMLYVMAVSVLVVMFVSNSVWADLSDGLVLHCEFDGDTQDSSGNNLHGSIRSGISYTAGIDGDADTAAYFSNSSAGIEFGNQSQINNLGNLFSIAFWTKIESGNGGLVFDHDVIGTYDNDWWGGTIGEGDDVGKLAVSMGNKTYSAFVSDMAIDDDQWHHVVFMRDQSAASAWWYIDGELDATRTGQSNEMLASTNFNLGAYDSPSGWVNSMVGSLDDFRLYNRALSESEIETLATPEPTTLVLLGLGGLLLRRKK